MAGDYGLESFFLSRKWHGERARRGRGDCGVHGVVLVASQGRCTGRPVARYDRWKLETAACVPGRVCRLMGTVRSRLPPDRSRRCRAGGDNDVERGRAAVLVAGDAEAKGC